MKHIELYRRFTNVGKSYSIEISRDCLNISIYKCFFIVFYDLWKGLECRNSLLHSNENAATIYFVVTYTMKYSKRY